MKLKVCIFLTVACFCNLSVACALFTTEKASMEYVGKIEFGAPIEIKGNFEVPINFKGGKWNENSAIGIRKFNVEVEDNKIYITVLTCAGGTKNLFQGITLKNVTSGQFEAIYRNPDKSLVALGIITI